MRSSGVICSQKSVERDAISCALRATPPVHVRRRASARALRSCIATSLAESISRSRLEQRLSVPGKLGDRLADVEERVVCAGLRFLEDAGFAVPEPGQELHGRDVDHAVAEVAGQARHVALDEALVLAD